MRELDGKSLKKIMEVKEKNSTVLELNDGELSSVSSLPHIPDCVRRLYIKMPALMELPELPDNLKKLEVENASLHGISSLPQKLSVIKLEYLSNLNQLNNLPSELKVLTLNKCNSLNLPMDLPHSLEELSVVSDIEIKWGIESLPQSLNKLNLGNVYIELHVLKGHDNLKRNGFDVKATLDFNMGDVVYGLAHSRRMITRELAILYDKKNIVIQNTLTNSVWDRRSPEEFSNDETIAQRLRDVERGIAFRDFLAGHPKYNVTTQSSEHRAYTRMPL